MSRTKTFCEFFAGIGLVHEALRASGWTCVYANDNDPKKSEMYRTHFGEAEYYHEADVWLTDEVTERIPGAPLLATASFPCTDMSLAGRMKGFQGSESSAFFGFTAALDALGERRPQLLMLENVVGFLTSRKGDDFRAAVEALAERGYWIDAMVLDAKDFVPQSRPRLFLFGFHESLESPLLVKSNGQLLHDPWRRVLDASPQLRPARLRMLQDQIELRTGWATLRLPTPATAAYRLADFIDADEEQDWWSDEMVDKHYRMMSENHRRRVDDWMASGESAVATIYRRIRQGEQRAEVRFDGVAGCLRTPRGGSARQIVLVTQPPALRMRWMSPREYARLQGASNYAIEQRANQALFGFGDAVCVPVVRWIDEHILTPLVQSALMATR